MMNVVYLVLVFSFSGYKENSIAVEKIPQANMKQCEVNQAHYLKINDKAIKRAYCIVGVK